MNNAKYTHKTRDGRLARIVSTDAVGNYPIVALVFDQNNNSEFAISLTENLTEYKHASLYSGTWVLPMNVVMS